MLCMACIRVRVFVNAFVNAFLYFLLQVYTGGIIMLQDLNGDEPEEIIEDIAGK